MAAAAAAAAPTATRMGSTNLHNVGVYAWQPCVWRTPALRVRLIACPFWRFEPERFAESWGDRSTYDFLRKAKLDEKEENGERQ